MEGAFLGRAGQPGGGCPCRPRRCRPGKAAGRTAQGEWEAAPQWPPSSGGSSDTGRASSRLQRVGESTGGQRAGGECAQRFRGAARTKGRRQRGWGPARTAAARRGRGCPISVAQTVVLGVPGGVSRCPSVNQEEEMAGYKANRLLWSRVSMLRTITGHLGPVTPREAVV